MSEVMGALGAAASFVGVKGALGFAAGFAADRWALPLAARGLSRVAAMLKPAAKE